MFRRLAGDIYRHTCFLPAYFYLRVVKRLPRQMLSFGGGLGDDLLCTTVLREMKKRSHDKLGMITRYPEIFVGNNDADAVLEFSERLLVMSRREMIYVKVPFYTARDPKDQRGDRDSIPEDHIIALMCSYMGLEGEVAIRSYWHFQQRERDFGKFAKVQVAIQSTCLSKDAKMPLKEWFPARFQEVVDRLSSSVTFVQVGRSADVPLKNVIDLRGKTSVRETAAVLSNSRCFVGLVGFLMHLARAVDCRSVIVYGGRETPEQTGYSANVNLYSPVACAPCWGWQHCDYAKACMENIGAMDVVSAVKQVLDEKVRELPTTIRRISSREHLVSRIEHLNRLTWATHRIYTDFPPGCK
jgi:Glycosyltransferase family 9 (heptosyltransferase)